MKKQFITFFILLFAGSAFSQNEQNSLKLNLNFEMMKDGKLADWFVPTISQYSTAVDSLVVKSGRYAFRIESISDSVNFQPCSVLIPGGYEGKEITLTGYIKTENVREGWAGLWMRIDPSIAFDNMQKNGIKGTTGWKKYEITLKLNPKKTSQIFLGALLVGKGKMWVDDLQVEVDGKDIHGLSLIPPVVSEFGDYSADTSSVKIKLPPPATDGKMSLVKSLWERRSVREYKDTCLSLTEVSQLLWAAYGISDSVSWNAYGLHTAPSAGALYPLEVYLVAGNVSGLPAGVYRYHPKGHYITLIKSGDKRSDMDKASYQQEMVKNAPASIVYSAVFSRTTVKYGDRGRERYVCMDLGHSGENVYLQATALGIGTCAIGAFTDSEVSKVMGMPKEEEPLYIMPLGKLKNN